MHDVVTRLLNLDIGEARILEEFDHLGLGIAPLVAHLDALVIRISPDREPCHLRVHLALLIETCLHVIDDLVHARQLENQLTSGFQNSPPLPQDFRNVPEIEMLDDVNRRGLVGVVILEWQLAKVAMNVRVSRYIDVYPSVPFLVAAAEMEPNSSTSVLQAFPTRSGANLSV